MTQFIFVTPKRSNFSALSTLFETLDTDIRWAASGRQTLEMVATKTADAVVTDEILDDMSGLDLAARLVAANPMVNCAVVSSLSAEDYHEASEGLGLLMQLPPKPGREDAQRLIAHLNQIVGLTATTKK